MAPMHITQISGVAGGGKTTFQVQQIAELLKLGIPADRIGSSTFTREGRRTMVHRTAKAFDIDPTYLTDVGWFKTMHATARRCLGVKTSQLLTDSPESAKWLSGVFGEGVSTKTATDAETGFPAASSSENTIDDALGWWGYVRNTLCDPRSVIGRWPELARMGFDRLWRIIERYERQKWVDGRVDFCDLLLRFVGRRVTRSGVEPTKPEGDLPQVAAWFFDEYQDSSRLVHYAARRLGSAESVRYIFVGGDPYQSLYGFAGGDPAFLLDRRYWGYDSRKLLHFSHRCPSKIISCSEQILSKCSDYENRGVTCRDTPGLLDYRQFSAAEIAETIDPSQGSWLVLARTNALAQRLGRILSDRGIPWESTRGGSYLSEPRREAAEALLSLQSHERLTPGQWRSILRTVDEPRLFDGVARLRALDVSEPLPTVTRDSLPGASKQFLPWLDSLDWQQTRLPHGRYVRALETSGAAEAQNPTTRLGTIHSSKGDEADNVLLYDCVTKRCRNNLRTIGSNEERRVWYVGATRARERLVIGRLKSDRHAMFS